MKQTTPRTSTRTGHDRSVMPFSFMAKSAAAASVAGLVFAASPAHDALAAAPDFVPKLRQGNPLMIPVGVNWWAKPALVDIDADGDMDIFIGDGYEGGIAYFENIGTSAAPEFSPVAGSDNPFWYYDSNDDAYYPYTVHGGDTPIFVDIDADGDMDAFLGGEGGDFHFFKNTGSETAPAFTRYDPSATENPLAEFYVGDYSTLAFTDLDGDGDMDALAGEGSGRLHYFKNTGTASAPEFDHYGPYDTQNPFYQVDVGDYSTPAFADIDGDGDMDALVGEGSGNVNFFKNTGTPFAPVFELQDDEPVSKYLVPSSTLNVDFDSAPALADIDNDGDMDVLVGDGYGEITVFKNSGSPTDPAFTRLTGTASPTFGFRVQGDSAPAFVDIDGDGDMDAFVGDYYGYVSFAENTGTATASLFTRLADEDDAANPFKDLNVAYYAKPAFADIDGDGDRDIVVGDYYGGLNFFENLGTASAPVFVERYGTDNPLDGVTANWNAAPAFTDIDGDGDLDLFVGDWYGLMVYFENAGSASAPDFTTSGIENPFGLSEFEYWNAPAFADIDGDGDMDAVVGTRYDGLHYFENTGSATAPAFTELTGTDNPFTAFGETAEALGVSGPTPAFVDIDGDGDMDLFVGEYYGRVIYFENRLITTPPADDDDDTPVALTGDSDTCFIDSVSGSAEKPNPLFGAIKNVYAAVRSILR